VVNPFTLTIELMILTEVDSTVVVVPISSNKSLLSVSLSEAATLKFRIVPLEPAMTCVAAVEDLT